MFLNRSQTCLVSTRSDADQNLHLLESQKRFVMLLIYVDNIVPHGSPKTCKAKDTKVFEMEVAITVANQIEKFLEISIEVNDDTVKMNNSPMVDRKLKYFNTSNCKVATTPLPACLDLSE